MNDNLSKNFCEMYRARVSATDEFVYSSLPPIHNNYNYIHEGPGTVKTEPIVRLHLPEDEYKRLCQHANQQNIETELRSRHGQVYLAWHQYQMMVQLYR
jgi:hypothetical protein